MQASLNRLAGQPPMLFPGLPLTLDLFKESADKADLASELFIDLFRRISSLQLGNGPARQPAGKQPHKTLGKADWFWWFIERPALSQIVLDNDSQRLETSPDTDLFPKIRQLTERAICRPFKDQRLAELRRILESIHTSWSEAGAPDYSESSLLVAEEIVTRELKSNRKIDLIPLLFELESFATTETIFKRMNPLASGMYGGVWLEIGTMPLHSVIGTELCQSARLYDELISLASGHTAPLIVNEFGCLADGNHRLTATWIWNILAACQNESWSLDDSRFQQSVSGFISSSAEAVSSVSLHEALHHLAVFLSDEELRAALIENLQKKHAMQPISELPVIPLLEYSSLAVVGETYADSKNCVRFEPNTYELFTKQNNVVLPARACYHFADRVPLPWFSIATTSSRPGLPRNKHHHWQSRHAGDASDITQAGA
jgi:hypothetical protein